MKKLGFYILFIFLFSVISWGQEKDHTIGLHSKPVEDSTQKLSRFLENIELKQDYSFTFDRDFLKPKEISLRKMLQIRYYNSINYLEENSLNETLYPNLNYPSGILINNSSNLLIKPFPQVNNQF